MAKLYINRNIVKDEQKAWELFLTGETGVSYSDINAFISALPADEPIDVELYSCGGDCTEGFAIYDALRTCGHELSTTVVGECASMATVIALCAPAENRRAFKHARFLIHEPYFPECICGDVTIARIEQLKEALETDKQKILDIYIERTGSKKAKITAQMEDGKWFDSERAMELGFISEIVPETSASASSERISTTINENRTMAKKDNKEAKSLWQKLGSILGMTEEENPVNLTLIATDGTELTIQRDEGDIQVGDHASPDGTFTLEDGRTITIQDGVITEIKQPEETQENTQEETQVDEEKKALQDRVAELEAQLAEANGNAKSEADQEILNAVKKLGGIAYIKSLPVGKVKLPTNERPQGNAEKSVFRQIMEREK